MAESKESVDCVVFGCSGDARVHGKGGIWYKWKPGSSRRFPEDVSSIFIVMPVGEWHGVGDSVVVEWTTDHKNHCGAQWQLSGSYHRPTLSPSLHWVNVWHGYLREGKLESC